MMVEYNRFISYRQVPWVYHILVFEDINMLRWTGDQRQPEWKQTATRPLCWLMEELNTFYQTTESVIRQNCQELRLQRATEAWQDGVVTHRRLRHPTPTRRPYVEDEVTNRIEILLAGPSSTTSGFVKFQTLNPDHDAFPPYFPTISELLKVSAHDPQDQWYFDTMWISLEVLRSDTRDVNAKTNDVVANALSLLNVGLFCPCIESKRDTVKRHKLMTYPLV
jgi:hypothetical protein